MKANPVKRLLKRMWKMRYDFRFSKPFDITYDICKCYVKYITKRFLKFRKKKKLTTYVRIIDV